MTNNETNFESFLKGFSHCTGFGIEDAHAAWITYAAGLTDAERATIEAGGFASGQAYGDVVWERLARAFVADLGVAS